MINYWYQLRLKWMEWSNRLSPTQALLGRNITRRQVRELDPIPKGWGISWYLPEMRMYRIHPIPFNWVFGWLRDRFYLLSSGFRSKIDAQWEVGLNEERRRGYDLGYELGDSDARRKMGEFAETWLKDKLPPPKSKLESAREEY